jgi:hypothetical protein
LITPPFRSLFAQRVDLAVPGHLLLAVQACRVLFANPGVVFRILAVRKYRSATA